MKNGDRAATGRNLDIAVRKFPLDTKLRATNAQWLVENQSYKQALWETTMAMSILDDKYRVDIDEEKETTLKDSMKNVQDRQKLRSRVLSLRASAYAGMLEYGEALKNYELALGLFPTHPGLQKATENIQMLIKAEEYGRKSSELFAKYKYYKASHVLTSFLKKIHLPHLHIGVLCNRASCFLATRQYEKCIQDCSRALNLHTVLKQQEDQNGKLDAAKCVDWIRTIHVRRGSALCWQGKLEEGLHDYEEALRLQLEIDASRHSSSDPSIDEASSKSIEVIKADISMIKRQLCHDG